MTNKFAEQNPIEMLERSHVRLLETLSALSEAALVPEQATPTIDQVLDHLSRSVARHEADEESSVFPRIRKVSALGALIEKLTEQHQTQHALHQRLAQWRASSQHRESLVHLAADLEQAYRAHIALEEQELFPAMAKHLTPEDMGSIALEMQERRGGGGGGGGGDRGGGGGGRGRGGGGRGGGERGI